MQEVYQILELPKFSEASEVKKAYRKLVKQWHPDINKSPDASEKFKKIQEAYELLMDPRKKQAYDLLLKQKSNPKTTRTNYKKKPQTKTQASSNPFITWIQEERNKVYEQYYQSKMDEERIWQYNFKLNKKNAWHQYSLFLIGLWIITFISPITLGYIFLPILSAISFLIGCKKD